MLTETFLGWEKVCSTIHTMTFDDLIGNVISPCTEAPYQYITRFPFHPLYPASKPKIILTDSKYRSTAEHIARGITAGKTTGTQNDTH